MKNKILNINITTSTIIKTIIIILNLWFLYYIKGIIGIFLIALLLTAALKPIIDLLEKKKIPRGFGISIVYLLLFGIITGVFILILPPMVRQLSQLVEKFPVYIDKISQSIGTIKKYSINHGWIANLNKISANLEENLTKFAGNIFTGISSIFGGVTSFIFILVIAFYMTLEKNAMERIGNLVIPPKYKDKILRITQQLDEKIGLWVRGQLTLMVIIGIFAFLGLSILKVDYALTLGLIAGLTEVIPYLGPILGAIPAIFLAFAQSPYKALLVIILYFIMQQIENNILEPKIMQKAVGLNPIIIIFALLIGAKIAGILGIILAIPVTTSIIILIKEFYPDIKGGKSSIKIT
ncbi:MAG: AI-2E family transporter [bacterium]